MAGTVEDMIAQAVKTLGVHETNGDNVNYITQWYGLNGQPWCDQAVTYWAAHSDCYASVCFGTKHAYTVEHAQVFKNHGAWHPMSNGVKASGIRRGDIIFFDWQGGYSIGGIDHVGIVEKVVGDQVHTIEGNYNNICGRFVRSASVIAGFGRPVYASPKPPVPVPPKPVTPAAPYISFKQVVAAANSPQGHVGTSGTPGRSDDDVKRVQDGLAKLGLITFKERGEYGPQTRDGYTKFQRSMGYSGADADGVPGNTSIVELGKKSGLFQVRDF